MSEPIINKIGPEAKAAVPELVDALTEDCEATDTCSWDGGETVDVSEYAQDELGEFYRMTSTEHDESGLLARASQYPRIIGATEDRDPKIGKRILNEIARDIFKGRKIRSVEDYRQLIDIAILTKSSGTFEERLNSRVQAIVNLTNNFGHRHIPPESSAKILLEALKDNELSEDESVLLINGRFSPAFVDALRQSIEAGDWKD